MINPYNKNIRKKNFQPSSPNSTNVEGGTKNNNENGEIDEFFLDEIFDFWRK